MNGIVLVNKPEGVTSFAVVARMRRIFKTRSVGHCGTLDPMATGILPILVGNAVKATEYLVEHKKTYLATMVFGIESDTEDISGNVTYRHSGRLPSFEEIKEAALSFLGDTMQIPPMYSALKVNGKKLVDLAREGIEVEREPRRISVYSMDVYEKEEKVFLKVECSKGTYIRTLIADIGRKLGCGAVMGSLTRLSVDDFTIDDCFEESELEAMTDEEKQNALIPVEKAFESFRSVRYNAFCERLAKNGCEIYLSKLRMDIPVGTNVKLYGEHGFFGLGVVEEFEKGVAIRTKKRFEEK
ncbi:MAG: tRNA pseudouridine(55) synthase TruB [Clostridia bacterium]|nr:tRNA pseudouridine(55) synthase TruB [Clostridia bacterium]